MKDEFIYLDLREKTLWGFEHEKSDLIIDAIIRGIEHSDDFEAVPVYRINDDNYTLVYEGHSRAVGHYIEGKPLKCILSEQNPRELRKGARPVKISNIKLIEDIGQYAVAKQLYPNYR